MRDTPAAVARDVAGDEGERAYRVRSATLGRAARTARVGTNDFEKVLDGEFALGRRGRGRGERCGGRLAAL
jgi:hypothetical protein